MINKFKSILLLLILTTATCIYSQNYTVKLKNHNNSIYSEKISTYQIFSSNKTFELPQTPFQTIISQRTTLRGKIIRIKCGGKFLSQFTSAKGKLVKVEYEGTAHNVQYNLNRYLEDTMFLNLNSPEINNTAKKFNPSDKDILNQIETFVYNHITNKTLGIPLLPAANIMEQRSGACTEHTVLAVALLRKNKIPTRAVVGVVLMPQFLGETNVFGYHMWAEVYINGQWELVDATTPGIKYPNRYITFAYHSLRSAMPISVLSAMGALSDVSITYVR